MSTKLDSLNRRLAKVEKAAADKVEQERLATCICKRYGESAPTIVFSSEPGKFEAEMNRTCPVHGFRHLGHLIVFRCADHRGRYNTRIDELMAEYDARRKAGKSRVKLEHDNQEV